MGMMMGIETKRQERRRTLETTRRLEPSGLRYPVPEGDEDTGTHGVVCCALQFESRTLRFEAKPLADRQSLRSRRTKSSGRDVGGVGGGFVVVVVVVVLAVLVVVLPGGGG
ncbi:hypothetical protein F4678DRAFT_460154 [Xylaria arbuscula]|nr:hypothetical protein F4678DRAFT_460154 [Xylaria arbuscula]